MLKKFTISVLLAAASIHALAVEWEPLSVSESGDTFFINKSSIAHGPNGITKVWTKIVTKMPETNAGDSVPTAYTLDSFYFKCAERTVALVAFARYDLNGRTLRSASRDDYRFSDIIPGSINEAVFESVCTR
jgi:hypothetical protein